MEPTMGDGAEELLHTYTEDGGINYLAAAAMLPSRSVIDDACAELMSLMFPGFRGEPLVDSSDLPQVTRSRLRRLQSHLKPEFCKSLETVVKGMPNIEARMASMRERFKQFAAMRQQAAAAGGTQS